MLGPFAVEIFFELGCIASATEGFDDAGVLPEGNFLGLPFAERSLEHRSHRLGIVDIAALCRVGLVVEGILYRVRRFAHLDFVVVAPILELSGYILCEARTGGCDSGIAGDKPVWFQTEICLENILVGIPLCLQKFWVV